MATMLSPPRNGAKTTTPPSKSTGNSTTNSNTPSNKYPHTRAQLSYFARQYKPAYASSGHDSHDNGDMDNLHSNEAELKQGVSQALVNEVVSLLGEEKDEELKALLKENYGMDDESVVAFRCTSASYGILTLLCRRLNKMFWI